MVWWFLGEPPDGSTACGVDAASWDAQSAAGQQQVDEGGETEDGTAAARPWGQG